MTTLEVANFRLVLVLFAPQWPWNMLLFANAAGAFFNRSWLCAISYLTNFQYSAMHNAMEFRYSELF